MNPFVYQSLPTRVVFGWGKLSALAEEIERLGAKRALILTTPEQQALGDQVAALLGNRAAGVYPKAVMHVPLEVAQAARVEAARLDADCCVAIGGGSTIGLGKAIRSEEHTSELQSLMRISYAVFCLKKKKSQHRIQ